MLSLGPSLLLGARVLQCYLGASQPGCDPPRPRGLVLNCFSVLSCYYSPAPAFWSPGETFRPLTYQDNHSFSYRQHGRACSRLLHPAAKRRGPSEEGASTPTLGGILHLPDVRLFLWSRKAMRQIWHFFYPHMYTTISSQITHILFLLE